MIQHHELPQQAETPGQRRSGPDFAQLCVQVGFENQMGPAGEDPVLQAGQEWGPGAVAGAQGRRADEGLSAVERAGQVSGLSESSLGRI